MNNEMQVMPSTVSIIDSVNLNQLANTMTKISQMQSVIQKTLRQNHDFGVVPGTKKPTLLKPGAEKILMLLGLRSEFEIVDSTRDFENGFFQYQVRCRLYKNEILITEGLGACNTRESKYKKLDPFTIDNTILKMAKKRALVDATLLVSSLSDIFEDMDLNGTNIEESNKKVYTDSSGTISKAQAKRMFAIAQGSTETVKEIIGKYGYTSSEDVKKTDYNKICEEIEAKVKDGFEGAPLS
ncbi:MAG: hypothetical protein N4A48_04005 [Tepidibacter sp.]|jgi:hypothetical protein|uniref:hypothetical protein n=1 Tax=Tepidibacter sp. TaxID=2529387 RepID=UPI0025D91D57|nr:hypothetical protein [Tepidibacter sp.]MCT4507913.1 hypothetical protein [Tepidibacter sp.]MCT4606888.1 hypothetical protein [Marinisporobacter sp.]